MAGYSVTPLSKKLGIKENYRLSFINAPKNFVPQLGKLPSNVRILSRLSSPLDLVVLFVDRETSLTKQFAELASQLASNGMLWVAWPKKSSGVATDLSFDNVQRIGLECGLVDVKICAIDEVWSGLKFVFPLKDRKR